MVAVSVTINFHCDIHGFIPKQFSRGLMEVSPPAPLMHPRVDLSTHTVKMSLRGFDKQCKPVPNPVARNAIPATPRLFMGRF